MEFMAAIPGTFFAGAALSILPGPIRRADPRNWAQATLDRQGHAEAIAVHDLVEVAHARRPTTFHGRAT